MSKPRTCERCDTRVSGHVLLCQRCYDDEAAYDDNDCANCNGEGFVYGCGWDWQCDTYDEGEGTCLCTQRCDWCNPAKPDPALQALLRDMLSPTPTPEPTDEQA